MNPYSIEICEITKKFGSHIAVDSLNLKIEQGTIFGFIGHNGAGKTTTIKLLLGLLKPDKGYSTIAGYNSWQQGEKIRSITGVMFEEPGLYKWLTGPENMLIFGKLYSLSNNKILNKIDELSEILNITDIEKSKPIRKLSRGNRQKWEIIKAFIATPKIVFMDEPTSGLDPHTTSNLRKYIIEISQKHGTTIFLNTHNLDEAIRTCTKIGVINNGKLTACKSPKELTSDSSIYKINYNGTMESNQLKMLLGNNLIFINPDTIQIRISDKNEISDIIKKLVNNNIKIYEATQINNPLEDMLKKSNNFGE